MNWEPRNIVVGTDGSELAQHAAQVAADIARSSGSTLHFVTVVRPPEGWWGVVGSPPSAAALVDAMTDAQRGALDATVASIDSDGLNIVTAEELGDPATQLVAYCESHDADLLVIGKRGAGFMERLMMGSVADRVVHGSEVPVLVVP